MFSNRRLGPSVEVVVSNDVAQAMLQQVADAIRSRAEARWELELLRWLDERARVAGRTTGVAEAPDAIDVSEIAWTRDHFDAQRWFVLDAVARAMLHSDHGAALERWRRMIEAHPRDSVQFGRRWNWHVTA